VAIVVRRGDRYLVLHSVPGGHWNHAAGQVEQSESAADAAQRELAEETGLESPVTDLAIPQHYPVPDAERDSYPAGLASVRVDSFVADAPAGWEPTLSHEHDERRWCTFAEALTLLAWPEARAALVAASDRARS
jgi:8-oxo-dGTP pyrophosphatase MutT (NUDIX family)